MACSLRLVSSSSSSSSSSDSDSGSSSQKPTINPRSSKKAQQSPHPTAAVENEDNTSTPSDHSAPPTPTEQLQSEISAETTAPKKLTTDEAFEDIYLKQATREFANDLDKLRSAGDFSERSVELLIAGLRQGRGCFSVEERRRVVGEGVGG
ncbi:hypothetical protein BDY17DRAFT_311505 [Neohortaea acidophila]|uniref:Ribosome assembly protein 3 n=1 Tax=Neohortaea acidophila TaxID=245834 RepID=A0A6A6PQC1_9PEZI|nr:uncharacterized protein BDY17DRAFT_311505 [Neohortaea acidophila]KAF2481871.1 hypothetical protein BDY17DRAFT_311505 [Neohortaea acidophila]